MEKIIISLAVWRIASLLAREDAPFRILARVREWLENSEHWLLREVSDAIHCVWCSSIWIGLVGALFISHGFVDVVINTLAISALSIIIERFAYG